MHYLILWAIAIFLFGAAIRSREAIIQLTWAIAGSTFAIGG
jgi:hypothetical protein